MQQLLLSTTGDVSTVIIEDLGHIVFTHPTANYNLLDNFDSEVIRDSSDIQNAIDANYIIIFDELNFPVPNVQTALDSGKLTFDRNRDNIVDNAEKLGLQLPSYYTNSLNINYNNSTSGIAANNVQDAVDEIATTYLITANNGLTAINQRVELGGGLTRATTIDGQTTHDFNVINVDNLNLTASILSIQGLIYPNADGNNGDVLTTDGAGNLSFQVASNAPVTSVFGRIGDVVAVAGDYTSIQITYDNVSSSLTATDVQAAIDELDVNVGNIPIINTTDDLAEGLINFYYTETRFDTSFATKSTTDLVEGTNLYYTDTRVSNNLDVAANTLKISADGSIDTHSDVDTSTTIPTTGQFLSWNGSNWIPTTSSSTDELVAISNNDTSAGFLISKLSAGNNITFTTLNPSANEQLEISATNAPVDSVFGRIGAVIAVAGDYDAIQITYDNASSGLTATDAQAAIDELDTNIASIPIINTTDDLIEGIINFYYTETRFNTSFAAKTTTDLIEGTNLYYTNTRVSANSDVVTNTLKISADGSIDTHSDVDTTTAVPNTNDMLSWDGSNWIPTVLPTAPVISVNTQTGVVVLDTDDINEGVTNLYYTDTRVDANFATKTTTDLVEGTNLYYTETRFDTSFATKSTTDLVEGTNLYYTDTRVSANVDVAANTLKISADGSIDTHSDVDTTTLAPSTGQFLAWDGTNWIPSSSSVATSFLDLSDTPTSYVGQAGNALVVTGGENGVEFQSIAGLGDMTKAVYDPNLIQLDAFDYNNFINTPPLLSTTDDLPEGIINFYYTETRFDTSFATKTTDNLTEGTSNLYYTETRFDTSFATKSTTDLVEGTNLYYTDTRVSANVDVTANTLKISADGSIDTHSDVDATTTPPTVGQFLQWDGSNWIPATSTSAVTSVFGRTGAIIAVAGDYSAVLITYDNVSSGLTAVNVQAAIDELKTITDTISGNVPTTTDDLPEGLINFYYTETRFDTSFATKSTTDLVEGTNLYYTDVRVDANFATKTTDDLAEGLINFYYTETRFDTSFATKSTTDLVEGTNLYYTDTRVSANPDVVANTLKISADGSIDTHADVDTTTIIPVNDQVLKWNGTNWIPGTILTTNLVTSVFGRIGDVVAVAGDYLADQVTYNNGTSGLAATNVQDAIDEQQFEIDGKINIVNPSTSGHAVLLTNDGQLVDAGFALGPQETNKFHVGKTLLQTVTSTVATTINWDIPDIENSAYTFDSTNGILTINETAWYDLTFHTSHVSPGGSTRTASKGWLEIDRGTGYTIMPYSEIIFYERQADHGSGGSISKLIQLSVGDLIRSRVQITAGSSAAVAANSTALTIVKSETGINVYTGAGGGPVAAIDVSFDKNNTRYVSTNVQDAFVELDKTLIPQIAQEFDAILRDQIRAENGDLALTDKICPAGIANNTNLISLENNNVIFLNGDVLNPLATLNKGDVFNFTADQGDKISSSRGSYVVSTTFGTMVWNTLAFAGKYFFTEVIRNSSPFRMYVSNFGALATVEVFKNNILDSTTIIQPNDTVEINATGIGEYFIQSNELIDIFAIGDNNSTDSRPLPPVASELLWWNSSTAVSPNTAKIAVMYPNTTIEYFFADGTTGTAIVQPGTSFALPNSVANYEPQGACYVRSAGVIGATNAADSDGNNGTAWIPPKFATYRFGLTETSQHASFVSRFKGSVKMFLPGNTTATPDATFSLIQSGTAIENGLFPYSTQDAVSRPGGTIYESDVPCNGVFDESTGDETLLIGGLPLRENIISVNGKVGQVQLDAIDIPYDNNISGLGATDVQTAIDEVNTAVVTMSITDLLDVDTTTIVPNIGDRFEWDGTNWVPSHINDRILDIYQDAVITNLSTIGSIALMRWDGIHQVGSHYTFNSLDTDIIINTTGWYSITYNLTFEMSSGNKKTNTLAGIYINGILVNGSVSAGYHNGSSNSEDSLGSTKKINVIVGDILTIRAVKISGTTTMSSLADGNTLTIIKI